MADSKISDLPEVTPAELLANPVFLAIAMAGNSKKLRIKSGTWTPVLQAGALSPVGRTFSSQVGNYTRIGNLVFIDFSIILTAKGTQSGLNRLYGLPFTANNAGIGRVFPANRLNMDTTNVGLASTLWSIVQGQSYLSLLKETVGGTTSTTEVDLTDTTQLSGIGYYTTSAAFN
jgi:hypothetical protein